VLQSWPPAHLDTSRSRHSATRHARKDETYHDQPHRPKHTQALWGTKCVLVSSLQQPAVTLLGIG
jgi:hypothetical protein